MLNVKLPNGHLTWPSKAQASLNIQHSTFNIKHSTLNIQHSTFKKKEMGNNKSQLVVAAIENGTVIDHIPAEKTYQVVNLLQLEKMDTPVTIGYNLPSKKIGKKGIIKVANKYFTDEEINRLSVVAPNIGLSIIKDYEIVEKKTVETPDTLRGIVKCNNPKCITNNEPMQTLFHTVDKVLGIVRCHYCDKEQQLDKVELCK